MYGAPLYNIKLSVRNLPQSIEFYKRVMAPLGFDGFHYWKDDPHEKADTWTCTNGKVYLELQEVSRDNRDVPFDRHRTGLYRVEFLSDSKERVDDFHRHLVKEGVEVLSGPEAMYQGYIFGPNGEEEDWYAVYFKDLDGIIFGYVFTQKDID